MEKDARIYVAGHRGLVGSAIMRHLIAEGYTNIITADHAELDLRSYADTYYLFETKLPQYVFLAAAKVGGIAANDSFPVDFLLHNLEIQNNVIQLAHRFGTKKLLFLASSCIYPRMAPQPIPEDALLSGPLEATNQWYAIAKIAGIKLCQAYRRQFRSDFISVMPTNLYGPNDNYDLHSAHVIPAMIRRFHEAKKHGDQSIQLWGTGTARREFLHADDLARACALLMSEYSAEEIINIGSGVEMRINELAEMIQKVVGYQGDIRWDFSKPDGTPRKLLNSHKIQSMGWRPKVKMEEGLRMAYADFLQSQKQSG